MPSYVRGGRPRLLTDAEIAELYASGLDSDTIGARAQCSGSTVLSIVRAAGGTVRKSGGRREWSPDMTKDEVVKLYLSGQSGPQIAAAAGCTPAAIYRVLRGAGVQLRDSVAAGKLAERVRARRYRDAADG